jgi:DNA-binding MarR family transcriptional regulator
MRTFRLNGQFMATGDELSRPAGLTSARWQVLGAVLQSPLTVSGIAREMGLTRQSVQRTANDLVGLGLAEYLGNPAHRRAPLMRPTPAGFAAVSRTSQGQHAWAERIVARVGAQRLRECVDTLNEVIRAVDELPPEPAPGLSGTEPVS